MATLEKHEGVYRIDFRFGGKRFRRSLKTDRERTARSVLARADDTLRRLELGQLTLPAGADVATFILSDGRTDQKPKVSRFSTLGALLDEYWRTLAHLEETTEHCVGIHIRHFRRVFGEKLSVGSVDWDRHT